MTDNKYLLRSLLFVPGHNDRLLESASRSEADVLLFDLEDSVLPAKNKAVARNNLKDKIAKGMFGSRQLFARVNDRESGFLLKDILALTVDGVSGFVYPKAQTGSDIYFFDKLLETIEYEKELEIGRFKIIPLIETSAAVLNAQAICQSSDRVIGIAFGCEDYVSDLGGIHDSEEQSIFTARALIAMAARANGVVPIDTVHIHVHDLEGLERNLKISKNLGFDGMLILHPKELALAHKYYSPSDDEVSEAEEILRLAREGERDGKGVALMNGKFIGPPIVSKAKKVLAKHALITSKNKGQK